MSNQNQHSLMRLVDDLGLVEDDINDLLNNPFIGNTLAQNSSLPGTIGSVVAANNLTTDRVMVLGEVADGSGSMLGPEIEEALIQGWNGINALLATTSQRGEFFVGGWIYRDRYQPEVTEVYTVTRLVSPVDNRSLNVPKLTSADYQPSGGTPTVSGLQKAAADLALFETVCAADEVDAYVSPVIALMTDGFMNSGPAAVEWRKFIQQPGRREKWQIFAACFANQYTVESFQNWLRQNGKWSQFHEWMTTLSGENTEERAAARLLFESSMTGWGYFVDSPTKIDKIKNPESLLRAQLYLAGEKFIVGVDSGYNGQGGLSMPPQNVLTAWHEPEEILQLLKVKLSSSLVRASQALNNPNVSVPANKADDDDSVV